MKYWASRRAPPRWKLKGSAFTLSQLKLSLTSWFVLVCLLVPSGLLQEGKGVASGQKP
jgi:hypothetical protein